MSEDGEIPNIGMDTPDTNSNEEEEEDSPELNLTEQQSSDLKEAFDIFDQERSGMITTRKLYRVMRSLGQNPTEAEVQDLINAVDDDGNGTIEYDEFVAMMSKKMTDGETDEEVKQAFKVFDQSSKGFIEVEDLQQLMDGLGSDLNSEEILEMIQETDSDGDGRVTIDDVMQLMGRK